MVGWRHHGRYRRTILNGTATLGGGFFTMFDARVVDNHGTVAVLVGTALSFTNNAVRNLAGSTFTIQGQFGTEWVLPRRLGVQ